jgi:nucleotide-binding universal stress UspA family protein
MFKKILAPTDGSDAALRAIEMASDLALKYDAELLIIHAMEEVGSSRVPGGAEWLAKIEHIRITESSTLMAIAEEIVQQAEMRARELGVAEPNSDIRAGHAADVIGDAAKENGADLIVMGRRGLGRVSDLLLGSVSHRVTQLADCACLTIK